MMAMILDEIDDDQQLPMGTNASHKRCCDLPAGTCASDEMEVIARLRKFSETLLVLDAQHDFMENAELRETPNAAPVCMK